MSQLNELPFRDLPMVLEAAFDGAKRKNEFEFCRALLRDGVAVGDAVDPLFEARRFIHQYITLLEAPIEESLKLRLMLTLYCHTIAVNDFYHVLANVLRITLGHNYAADPFTHDPRGNEAPARTVEEKATRLAEWAEAANIEELADLVTETVLPEVRRGFANSTYSLDESQFHYRTESGAPAKLSLEWCLPRFNRGVAVALTFIDGLQRHQQSYTANKIVTVTTADGTTKQMELIARGGIGLFSFREVPAEPAVTPAPETPASVETKA